MKSHVGLLLAVLAGLCLVSPTWAASAAPWLGPSAVTASADGRTLFVACGDANEVLIVDVASKAVAGRIQLPASPAGLATSPDGKTLYVACAAPRSTIAVLDIEKTRIVESIPAGHTATAITVSPDGGKLYVCHRYDNAVAVFDLKTKRQEAKVRVIREPCGAVVTPDGKSVFVINQLPLDAADGSDVAAEVSAIDTASNNVQSIRLPNGSTNVRGIAISPDGKHVYVTHILARYRMPTTQLERGWMNTNALSVIDVQARRLLNTVLLDDLDQGAANPWAVAATADGRWIVVSHAGSNELSIIDAAGMLDRLRKLAIASVDHPLGVATPIGASATAADVPNDLSFLVGIRRRVRLAGVGPRGLAVSGSTAYVAEYFSDAVEAVTLDDEPSPPLRQIALGPTPKMSVERRGEMLFHSADLCFQHWQSCSSCHPDARADGLNWDLLNDGIGNPKNTRSMLLAHQANAVMATGVRKDAEAAVRAGIRHIQFAVRPEEDAQAIDAYLKSLRPVPSPHLADGRLSPAAQRGRKIFFDPTIGCAQCHPEPTYSDKLLHDMGSAGPLDRPTAKFTTPVLVETWRTAPYLHDGRYTSIKDLLVVGKHGGQNGNLDALSAEQIDDLVEFLLSL